MVRPLVCLVLVLFAPGVALAEETTLYWDGTVGDWSGEYWYENADLSGDPQAWQDGSRAVITGSNASVVVDQAIVAAGVDLDEDAEIRLGGSNPLTIEGATDGEGTIVFTNTSGGNMGPDRGLIIANSEEQDLAWRLRLNGEQTRVSIRGHLIIHGAA